MAYPDKPTLDYSFTGFAQSQGDNSFPGTNLDATIDFVSASIRSDNALFASALPTELDLTEYVATATAAASSAQSSATSAQSNASLALTRATAADASATAAATSASNAAATLASALVKANNLSDLTNAATARTNLGLGTAATTAATAYATAAQGTKADTALQTLPSGSVVQVVNTQTGAVATGTTTIPLDDTIPQNTEGDQYMSLAITPTNSSNLLYIDVVFNGANSVGSGTMIVALFQDSTANALAVAAQVMANSSVLTHVRFAHKMTAGTTSATTFKVRAGFSTAATVTFNGATGARLFGGAIASSITITEVKA